jgi:hypothetical protein
LSWAGNGLLPAHLLPLRGVFTLIQITRLQAKTLRSVIKRSLPRQATQPVLSFRTSNEGLIVKCQGSNQAICFHDPEPQEPEQLWVPLNVLADVQGARLEPVFLNQRRAGVIGASWQDKGVFHDLEYDAPEPLPDSPAFPSAPAQWSDNPAVMLDALRNAYETTDTESKRYALGCIQIRGADGVIGATDGRQLLKQAGFSFGFSEEVLLEQSRFFSSKELPSGEVLRVGKTETHLVFAVGHWTYWLKIATEGRFPDIDRSIPSTNSAYSTLKLSPADAKFFIDNMHRLPSGDRHRELTVDLNGSVVLRATSVSALRPGEITLRNSVKQGDDLRVCTDRQFLARAASMGFTEIQFPNSTAPAVASDGSRTYVWMLLDPKDAVKPSEDSLHLESPLIGPDRDTALARRRAAAPTIREPGHSPTTARTSELEVRSEQATPAIDSVKLSTGERATALSQLLVLRSQLLGIMSSVKTLIGTTKQDERNRKSRKAALTALHQLPNVT